MSSINTKITGKSQVSDKPTLNKLFDKIRQQHLKEDFEVGQAAQSLHELQKTAKRFNEFLQGPFSEKFKQLHNDPRLIEDNAKLLSSMLKKEQDELISVIAEMDSYISDIDMYVNPQSPNKDGHRNNRWTRWEHKTPRHIQRAEDKVNDL